MLVLLASGFGFEIRICPKAFPRVYWKVPSLLNVLIRNGQQV